VPFHGGFGLLNVHGIPKPVYRAFELLHRTGNEILHVQGQHSTLDAWVIRQPGNMMVLVTNHALPRQPIATEDARLRIKGVGQPRSVVVERIDENHANAKRAWQQMGEAPYLHTEQIERLQEASRLRQEQLNWTYENQALEMELSVPPHAVAALTVEFDTR
jgi:xylan 1,4-beta-xylosidase